MTPPDRQAAGVAGSEARSSVSVWQVDGAVVVAPTGAVDLATAPQFGNAVFEAVADRPARLIIDLTAVDFLASMGLTVLLKARRDLGTGTVLRVVATGTARRAIDVTGLDGVLAIDATLADALTGF
jgi:anti-anti-sigma factor